MSNELAQMEARFAQFMDEFMPHYEFHVVSHLCQDRPLDAGCKYCQMILKKKEADKS